MSLKKRGAVTTVLPLVDRYQKSARNTIRGNYFR
jgi:hypothetical protein